MIRIASLALLVAGGGVLLLAWQIPLDPWLADELINARTFPMIGAGIMLGGSVLLWFGPAPDGEAVTSITRPVGLIAACLVGAALVELTGIWMVSALLVGAGAAWLGERRPWLLFAAPIAIALGLWLLVEVVLGVDLPAPGIFAP